MTLSKLQILPFIKGIFEKNIKGVRVSELKKESYYMTVDVYADRKNKYMNRTWASFEVKTSCSNINKAKVSLRIDSGLETVAGCTFSKTLSEKYFDKKVLTEFLEPVVIQFQKQSKEARKKYLENQKLDKEFKRQCKIIGIKEKKTKWGTTSFLRGIPFIAHEESNRKTVKICVTVPRDDFVAMSVWIRKSL